MSFWSRIGNVFRGGRLDREIEEELAAHLADAIEHGRDPGEARRAFGSTLHHRENSREVHLAVWLDSLRADAVFGWRQLRKNRVSSAAAVLSLGLAIGSCTAAFRLIDALLLRPLPIAHPERLYALYNHTAAADGTPRINDTYEYPLFRRMRSSVKDQAELIAATFAYPVDLTYGSAHELEKARAQYVSGWMFDTFGLRPAAGRLLTENDDLTPGAHPTAVLSYDYWTSRFGQDRAAVGRTFRMNGTIYTIVGVCEKGFTGTQTGIVTAMFLPTMMHPAAASNGGWIRTLVSVKPGVAPEPVRDRLRGPFRELRQQWARGITGTHPQQVERYLSETLMMEPAAGSSGMQRDYRGPLLILGGLVTLVLLIACANVANLTAAQAAARAREMALRVSIGAGRARLVQLVLVESACLAILASAAGSVFAWWSAPFVGRIDLFGTPAHLPLPLDWRVLGFAVALVFAVTLLFGLAPALRASAIRPASVLKGGDPHSRRRLMHTLVGLQAAFCFVILFLGGLFIRTYDRLAKQNTGFWAERLLLLDMTTDRSETPARWDQAADSLRSVPGVESVAVARWSLLSGNVSVGSISVDGAVPQVERSFFLNTAPGWLSTMGIPLHAGRDFRAGDAFPGVAIVNEAFVKQYFHGADPVGKYFTRAENRVSFQIVGITGDARYQDMRGPMMPVAYVPMQATRSATLVVRTAMGNPRSLAQTLRQSVQRAQPEFVVSNIDTQDELVRQYTLRERLLSMLAIFFASVALLLAAIGLYGVLDYSVLQRRREIGIRVAVGAQPGDIARSVTADVFRMVLGGTVAGLGLGLFAARYIQTLLFQVAATDFATIAVPLAAILIAAALAALPAVRRALGIDPVGMLRSE